jgi:2,3-diketo-5-methylthiopentyl-1-phosphate enolase
MNRFYLPVFNPITEGLHMEEYIVATYLVGATIKEDPIVKGVSIAVEQTTGSWADIAGETQDIREKYSAKLIGFYEVPDYGNDLDLKYSVKPDELRHYIMRLAFPIVNFDDNVPLMLQAVAGNITALPHLKLVDLEFPKTYVNQFKGPKFGIEGIRDILGVYDRPILNNMIKPCTGYTPEVGADLFYQTAVGGVDFIKDDELIAGDRSFSRIEDRVRMNMAAAEKANKIKGEKTLYTVNITDEFTKLKDNAMRAIKAGTNAIMIDVYTAGLSALRMLAEDPEINVPILAHPGGVGAITVSPYQGIAYPVMAKLCRLCGADIQLVANPYGKFDLMKYPSIRAVNVMRNKLYDVKSSMPLFGGGTIPGNIPMIMNDVGIDCIMGAGAAVHAFPMGPTKGAQALRQSITATLKGVPLREAAKESEELQCAIDTWGIVGEIDVKKNFLI